MGKKKTIFTTRWRGSMGMKTFKKILFAILVINSTYTYAEDYYSIYHTTRINGTYGSATVYLDSSGLSQFCSYHTTVFDNYDPSNESVYGFYWSSTGQSITGNTLTCSYDRIYNIPPYSDSGTYAQIILTHTCPEGSTINYQTGQCITPDYCSDHEYEWATTSFESTESVCVAPEEGLSCKASPHGSYFWSANEPKLFWANRYYTGDDCPSGLPLVTAIGDPLPALDPDQEIDPENPPSGGIVSQELNDLANTVETGNQELSNKIDTAQTTIENGNQTTSTKIDSVQTSVDTVDQNIATLQTTVETGNQTINNKTDTLQATVETGNQTIENNLVENTNVTYDTFFESQRNKNRLNDLQSSLDAQTDQINTNSANVVGAIDSQTGTLSGKLDEVVAAIGEGEEEQGTISGGTSCTTAPTCSGDVLTCHQIYQQWETRCNNQVEEKPNHAPTTAEVQSVFGNDVPTEFEDLSTQLDNNSTTVSLGEIAEQNTAGNCPAPLSTTVLGNQFTVSFELFCNLAALISNFIMISAWLFSFSIVYRGVIV